VSDRVKKKNTGQDDNNNQQIEEERGELKRGTEDSNYNKSQPRIKRTFLFLFELV